MFNRKMVSLLIFFITVFLIFSGFVLFIMPHGRVAYWTDWRFLKLNKDQWSEIHVIFSIGFIILFVIHTFFNIKSFINYLLKAKKELVVSLVITIFIVIGGIINFFPFNSVVNFENKIKASWIDNKIAPKIPHGELLSLGKLIKKIKVSKNLAILRLERNGIKFESLNETIKEIAKKNKKKPVEIFQILKGKN